MPPMKNQKKDFPSDIPIPTPPNPPAGMLTNNKAIPDFEEDLPESQELPPITPSNQPEFEPMSMEESQEEIEPAPTPSEPQPSDFSQFKPQQYQQPNFLQAVSGREEVERIEEIAESIIREKWDDLLRNIGDISLWRENVKTEISSIKQELIRTQDRFENLQKAVLGKVKDYDSNVRDLGSEMKALQKVFEKILSPLSTNIKELQKITKDLKSKR